MKHLNLNLLRSLAVLLEQRNVTHAADKLYLTQSAMSRQLSQLRDFFNDELLVREGNDYLLTTRALQLKPKVQNLITDISDLTEEALFNPYKIQRKFSFACTDYVANFIFPDLLKILHQQAPSIDISYRLWQPEWFNNLGSLPIDFVTTMASEIPENLYGIYLGEDSPVLLMANSHPLANIEQPDLEQVINFPFIQITAGGDKDTFFDSYLRQQKCQRRIAFEVPFFTSAFNVCAGSNMLLIAPKHIAINAAQVHPITWREISFMELPTHSYYLFWHSIHNSDQGHRWARELLAEIISKSIFSPPAMQ